MSEACASTESSSAINPGHTCIFLINFFIFKTLNTASRSKRDMLQIQSGHQNGVYLTMIETELAPMLQKSTVIWSERQERDIAVRIYYDAREQDGCKIYTLRQVEQL